MRRKTKPKATTPFLLAQPSPQPAPPRPSTHQRGLGPHSLSLPRGLLPTPAQLPSAPSLHRTGPASTHGPSLAALSPAHARECHPPTRRSTCQPFQPHARRPRPRLLSLSRGPTRQVRLPRSATPAPESRRDRWDFLLLPRAVISGPSL